MHAWDQPAEALVDAGSKGNVPLLMPQLGQAVEPAHADGRVDRWWRKVDSQSAPVGDPAAAGKLSSEVPWPLD